MPNNFRINPRGFDEVTKNIQKELDRRVAAYAAGSVDYSASASRPALEPELLRGLDYVGAVEAAGSTATIGSLRALLGESDGALVAQALADRGLLRPGNKMVRDYHLTADGKYALRAHRRVRAQNSLLNWLDTLEPQQRADPSYLPVPDDGLEPYTEHEIQAAVEFLIDQRLAATFPGSGGKSWGGYVTVWITELGRQCVEAPGNIEDFLSRRDQPVSNTQNFNIGGSNNTVVGTAGHKNQVTVTVDNFDIDAVRHTAAAVRQSREALDLPGEATTLLDTIEHSQDRGMVQRAGRELYLLLAATSTGALGNVLAGPLGTALGIGH